MSWFTNIFSGGISDIVKAGGDLVDRFIENPTERNEFKLKLESIATERLSQVEKTMRSELRAKETLLKSELEQGDKYTKRARPTVVYGGLVMIAFNYCLAPLFGTAAFELPVEFWAAWGGIVSSWVIGRSYEKAGNNSKLSSVVTGSKSILEGD